MTYKGHCDAVSVTLPRELMYAEVFVGVRPQMPEYGCVEPK